MVPAASRGIPRVPRYSGAGSASAHGFAYAAVTLCGPAFQRARLPWTKTSAPALQPRPGLDPDGLGSSAFARRYWRNHCYFLLLRVLRCFSSPRSPRPWAGDGIAPAGLPHSDIRASQCICHYARLFAAYHVLLRLREPQASPARPCSLSFLLSPFQHARPLARKHSKTLAGLENTRCGERTRARFLLWWDDLTP